MLAYTADRLVLEKVWKREVEGRCDEYDGLKDEPRDVDTETEEELLLLVLPGDASNRSRSECSSPSDRSSSADGCEVQIFVGDEPFAGLFKGSVIADSETAAYYAKSEKPATYSPLRNVYGPSYDYVANGCQDAAKNERSAAAVTVAAVSSGGPSAATHQPIVTTSTNGVDEGTSSSTSDQNLFDEQEEWAKISEIMASFGKGNGHQSSVAEVEHQFESRSDRSFENSQPVVNNETSQISSVGQWLQSLGFMEFENAFVNFGYDDINFINGVINDCDLKEIGVMRETDRQTILKECASLPNLVGRYWRSLEVTNNPDNVNDLVKRWLNSINLGQYVETFRRNLYNDLDRIKRIWEVELTAFLEITKPGHRRRILASVNECKNQPTPQPASTNGFSLPNNLDELHADLDQLKNNIQELEEEIRTKNSMNSLESRCKTLPLINSRPPPVATYQKSATSAAASVVRPPRKVRRAPPPPTPAHDLPIRSPSELLVGVPTLEAQWRHKPSTLVNSTVDYRASYLGSTVVKEVLGTESTKKSIQKLRKSTSVVDCRITPEIILAISYRGVKFLNVPDNSLICEHEIRNIHCACQDSEDLTHFAYITKDRASRAHYCHVFCVQTMDEATEVILTLGQAFEVAYQMALKKHSDAKLGTDLVRSHSTGSSTVTSKKTRNGHLAAEPLPPMAPAACGRLSRYFAPDSGGRVPLLALLAEARFDEVKRLLEVAGASDVEMLRRLALSVASAEFRNRYRVEKKVADEVFAQAIAELSYRSQNTGQLRKYYRTSYSEGAPTDGGAPLSQYLARAADSRVPLWTMMVERRYDEVGRVLGAAPTASELDVLKLVAASVADKAFRETHGVSREVADEVFECAADELMAGEGTVAQLLDLYNKSYN